MSNYYTLLFDDHVTTDELEQLLEQFGMDEGVWFDDECLLPSTTVIKAYDHSDGVAVRLIQSIYDCDVNDTHAKLEPTWCEISMCTRYTITFDEGTNLDDFDELMDFFGVFNDGDFYIDEWDEDELIMEIEDGGSGAGVRLIQSIYDCNVQTDSVEVSLFYDPDEEDRVPDGYHSSGYCFLSGLRDVQYTLRPNEVESFIEDIRSVYDEVVVI